MDIPLKYGNESYNFEVPDFADILNIREPEFNIKKDVFCKNLISYLTDAKKDFSDIGIVVADKTRLCDYPGYLPWLLKTLGGKGAKPENITFYIAYGTHPKQSDEESLKSYGETYKKYKFIHHNCNEQSIFTKLGTTKCGTEIVIRKDILKSTLIITFGAISHHYFAGFGGGRKLLFPGLAEKNAIYHNHSLFLNFKEKKLEEGCQPGNLEGNPVSEDLKEIDALLPEKISIHGILNAEGKVCQLLFGKSYEDFLAACQQYNRYYKTGHDRTYDLVVASSGGSPRDINFIQAHKSVHNAAAFVKDGGVLVILSECRDGIGTNTFLPLFKKGPWNKMFDKLAEKYEGNGGTALAMKAKTNRIKIYIVTKLDKETCKLMGTEKIEISQIEQLVKLNKGRIAVIQNASMLVR